MRISLKGMCYTVCGSTCWGLSSIMASLLFQQKGLSAVWLVTLRLLVGGTLMLLVAFAQDGKTIFSVWKQPRSAFSQLIFCFCGMSACQATYFLAVENSNAGTATVLQYAAPVLILLWSCLRQKRPPRLLETAVLITVVVGVILLATHGDFSSIAISRSGLIWGLLSALTYAIYSVQPKKLMDTYGVPCTVGWGMLLGGLHWFLQYGYGRCRVFGISAPCCLRWGLY